jgi:hypothetical protein
MRAPAQQRAGVFFCPEHLSGGGALDSWPPSSSPAPQQEEGLRSPVAPVSPDPRRRGSRERRVKCPTIRGGHHVANAHGFQRRQPWRLSRVHARHHPAYRRRRRPRCAPRSSGPLRRRIRRRPVEFATLEWVDWFNNRRLLEPIGNIPPAEAEERYSLCWNSQPWRRDSNQTASGKPGAVQCAKDLRP